MSRFSKGDYVVCVEDDGFIRRGERGTVLYTGDMGARVDFVHSGDRYMLNSELKLAPKSDEAKQIAELNAKMDAMATELADVKALVKQSIPQETPIIKNRVYLCELDIAHRYGEVIKGQRVRLDDIGSTEVGIFVPDAGVDVVTGDWLHEGRYYGIPHDVFKRSFRLG